MSEETYCYRNRIVVCCPSLPTGRVVIVTTQHIRHTNPYRFVSINDDALFLKDIFELHQRTNMGDFKRYVLRVMMAILVSG